MFSNALTKAPAALQTFKLTMMLVVALTFSQSGVIGAQTNIDAAAGSKPNTAPLSTLGTNQDCRFVGRFTQSKQLAGVNKALESNGKFLHDCERGVIWMTQTPVLETLILLKGSDVNARSNAQTKAKAKPRAYRYINAQLEQLKNRQSKFLTEFIMSLMAGNRAELAAQFDIKETQKGQILTPKSRRIRRAIQQVLLALLPNKNATELTPPLLSITLIDRNQQQTEIIANRHLDTAIKNKSECLNGGFPEPVCALMFTDIEFDAIEPR